MTTPSHSNPVNVVLIMDPDPQRRAQVEAVAPARLVVTEIPASDFVADGSTLFPPGRGAGREATTTAEQRAAAMRDAHAILLGLPYPTTLHAYTGSNLRWVHHPAAGASNLKSSDFWGSAVDVTTARGTNSALPIAESAVAAAMMFARGMHIAARGMTARRDYAQSITLADKTMGVVGLGGIGAHVARLSRGLGMRTVATRWSASARQKDVDGVDVLFPAAELHAMLAESDFVAVCAMWTEETERLIDTAAFAAMKEGAFLLNIARGEIVDEPAFAAALDSGRLRGAYLDVYAGEMSGRPFPPELVRPNVVFTPHVSGMADNPGPRGWDLFLENLGRFVAGDELKNVIDWSRGY